MQYKVVGLCLLVLIMFEKSVFSSYQVQKLSRITALGFKKNPNLGSVNKSLLQYQKIHTPVRITAQSLAYSKHLIPKEVSSPSTFTKARMKKGFGMAGFAGAGMAAGYYITQDNESKSELEATKIEDQKVLKKLTQKELEQEVLNLFYDLKAFFADRRISDASEYRADIKKYFVKFKELFKRTDESAQQAYVGVEDLLAAVDVDKIIDMATGITLWNCFYRVSNIWTDVNSLKAVFNMFLPETKKMVLDSIDDPIVRYLIDFIA